MKTLASPAICAETVDRLGQMTADRERRWGTLTPHEMLCHVADAFDLATRGGGSKKVPALRRTVVKWVGLYLPIPWPRGIKAPAGVDPRRNGTVPVSFERDRERAQQAATHFADLEGRAWAAHPMFGPLSTSEWMRWGYLHADHHLRQFGL